MHIRIAYPPHHLTTECHEWHWAFGTPSMMTKKLATKISVAIVDLYYSIL